MFGKVSTSKKVVLEFQLKDGTAVLSPAIPSQDVEVKIQYYYQVGFLPLNEYNYTPISRVEKICIKEAKV